MRLLCICVLLASAAGLCRGGAEEQPAGSGRVTVTCTDGNNQTILLHCDRKKLSCSSGDETQDNDDRFSIYKTEENGLFQVRRHGGKTSNTIAYYCHMTGVPALLSSDSVDTTFLRSIWEVTHLDLTREKERVRIRKSRENSAERTSEGMASEKKGKKKKCKTKGKAHGHKNPGGHRGNCADNKGEGNSENEGNSDSRESNAEEDDGDHSEEGDQTGGSNSSDTTEPATKEPEKDVAGERDDNNEDKEKENQSSVHSAIVVLVAVLFVFLVAGGFLLCNKKQKSHGFFPGFPGGLKTAGGGTEVELGKVAINAAPNNPGGPELTKPYHIYQEIDYPAVNIPYSVVSLVPKEAGADQNVPYSVVNLAPKEAEIPQNSVINLAPKEDEMPQNVPYSVVDLEPKEADMPLKVVNLPPQETEALQNIP